MKKKAIFVLGVHRSGTSLLTAGLEVLGFDLGDKFNYVSEENPKGFFEHEEIVHFNDQLLDFLGGRWDNPFFSYSQALRKIDRKDLDIWIEKAAKVFQNNFNSSRQIAIKDPRMCQLVPFWRQVLLTQGFTDKNLFYVHIARAPYEVALSQQRRQFRRPEFYAMGEDLAQTFYFWLALNNQSLSSVYNDNNIYVLYDEILNNSLFEMRRIASFVKCECNDNRIKEFCGKFVDKSLKRNSSDNSSNNFMHKKFVELESIYNRLASLSKKDLFGIEEVVFVLNEINTTLESDKYKSILSSYISRIISERSLFSLEKNDLLAANTKLQSQVDEILAANTNFQSQVDEIYESNLWKLTEPIRLLGAFLQSQKKIFGNLVFHLRENKNKFSKKNPVISKCLLDPFCSILRFINLKIHRALYRRIFFFNKSNCYQLSNVNHEPPLVTVIVPNFNHGAFLEKRLDSIYGQTYKRIEVILLDDCSQDNSRDVIKTYSDKYKDNTRVVFNSQNSGGVWFQWQKGLSLATGDLIWIAESDDYCTNNFLEETIKSFDDESVMLSYCRSIFVDSDSNNKIWTIEEYLSDIDNSLWQNNFSLTSNKLVDNAWSIKNIVPNASSAVFRNPTSLPLVNKPYWQGMRICGDWLFYLHLVRGGMVSYNTTATNYYRIHKGNASVATHAKDIYYREHELVAKSVNKKFNVAEKSFNIQAKNLKKHWKQTRPIFSEELFEKVYSLSEVLQLSECRKPNVLIASYAFAAGGGETFPIFLANLLKERGYSVTFLSCEQEPRENGVREMLHKDIPVVTNFYNIVDIIEDFGIDIVHSHHAWVDNTILDLLPLNSTCKHVVSLHGMYDMIDPTSIKKILKRMVNRCGKLVYTAEKNLLPFKQLGLESSAKLVKINNALDLYPGIAVDLNQLGIDSNAFVVCLVSRAIPEKGWVEAIDVTREARKISGKNIHLLLIGEGPEYDSLRNNSPDYVHFLGFRPNIRDYYAAAHIGFLPSRFLGESFPLTIIDCLHAGRPVLASDLGEISDMLSDGDVAAGSIFSLVNGAIPITDVAQIIAKYALDNDFYKVHLDAVRLVAKKFCPERLVSSYEKVYREVL